MAVTYTARPFKDGNGVTVWLPQVGNGTVQNDPAIPAVWIGNTTDEPIPVTATIGSMPDVRLAPNIGIIGSTLDIGFGLGIPTNRYTTYQNSTAVTDVTAAPTSGARRVVVDLFVSVNVTTEVLVFEEDNATPLFGAFLVANCGWQSLTTRGIIYTATDKKLQIQVVESNVKVRATTLSYSQAV